MKFPPSRSQETHASNDRDITLNENEKSDVVGVYDIRNYTPMPMTNFYLLSSSINPIERERVMMREPKLGIASKPINANRY